MNINNTKLMSKEILNFSIMIDEQFEISEIQAKGFFAFILKLLK